MFSKESPISSLWGAAFRSPAVGVMTLVPSAARPRNPLVTVAW
jgi:hypothetical protein